MSETVAVRLTVNGATVERDVQPRLNLVDFLRDELGLTGTHWSCEHGACGACTVRVDGEIVRGCLVFAVQLDGATVETVEGLTDSGALAELQAAFHVRNAVQCGYCTPAMLLTADALLRRDPDPSRETIRAALSANYCRCTGYHAIVDAVADAARERAKRP
ncbi:MAG TPA: (2Fe-2S)-binding protein [Stellaceae bacterium]|nr:(2Fe-2S)-binding protein [Stellaceae bacterium]